MYKYITLPSNYDSVKNVKKNSILYFSFDQREKLKKKLLLEIHLGSVMCVGNVFV